MVSPWTLNLAASIRIFEVYHEIVRRDSLSSIVFEAKPAGLDVSMAIGACFISLDVKLDDCGRGEYTITR